MKPNYEKLLFAALAGFAWFAAILTGAQAVKESDGAGNVPRQETEAADAVIPVSEAVTETPEGYENEKIEAALLDRAHKIEECTVTWYTDETCGKRPGDPAYGITASGYPTVEHLTCAVDPAVIPLYADVFVEYEDGTVEQLWATDTGVKGEWVDIYTPSYDDAIRNGLQHLTVWWVKD